MPTETRTQVWSCGGGTQSAAIAALIIQGRLPKPDIALIIDTEREKQSTWDYYNNILVPKLRKVNVELIRIAKSEFCSIDLVADTGQIMLPGYTVIDGKQVKQSGFCSTHWKKRVAQRFVRSIGVKQCYNWLGISTDEMKRVRQSDLLWWQNKYPLIFEVPMSRQKCIELVMDEMGWPKPPRSSCWMCPNMGEEEIFELPMDEIDKRLELQNQLQVIDPNFTLEKADGCASGMCFV